MCARLIHFMHLMISMVLDYFSCDKFLPIITMFGNQLWRSTLPVTLEFRINKQEIPFFLSFSPNQFQKWSHLYLEPYSIWNSKICTQHFQIILLKIFHQKLTVLKILNCKTGLFWLFTKRKIVIHSALKVWQFYIS